MPAAHSKEARENALDLASEYGVAEASRKTGISASTIRSWRKKTRQTDKTGRDKGGRWVKGVSGNPGGRTSAIAAAEKRAAEEAPDIIQHLIDIIDGKRLPPKGVSAKDFLGMCREVLDRGMGKPRQRQEITGADGGDLRVKITDLGDLIEDSYGQHPDQGPSLDEYYDD